MFDRAKRRTLKLAGASTVSAMTTAKAFASVVANDVTANAPPSAFGVAQLLIRIDSSTVAFTNLTDTPVAVKHFAPGSVQWQDKSVDLNAVRWSASPHLPAYTTARMTALVRQSNRRAAESIWADEAIVFQPDGQPSVLLGAYQHQHLLHVFPIPSIKHHSPSPTAHT